MVSNILNRYSSFVYKCWRLSGDIISAPHVITTAFASKLHSIHQTTLEYPLSITTYTKTASCGWPSKGHKGQRTLSSPLFTERYAGIKLPNEGDIISSPTRLVKCDVWTIYRSMSLNSLTNKTSLCKQLTNDFWGLLMNNLYLSLGDMSVKL